MRTRTRESFPKKLKGFESFESESEDSLLHYTESTQLTKICLDGNTQVDTIKGVYILTLSDNCPKANAPDDIFTRNPHVVLSQQLIALPLIQTAAEWFDTIDSSLAGIDLKPVLEEVKSSREGLVSIEVFCNQIETKNTRFYRNVIDYVQLALTAIAVIYAMILPFKLLRYCVFTRLPCCCRYCKKDRSVKQYTAVPRLAGKQTRPNSKACNLLNDKYVKAQPSAPISANINPG